MKTFLCVLAAGGLHLAVSEAKIVKWARDNTPSWVPPRETATAGGDFGLDFAPAAPEPTSAPREDLVELLKRQSGGVNTCGYINGVANDGELGS